MLIKRINNDPHSPGVWEIPGGRLEFGENPFEGLKRETKEETGLSIEITNPLGIDHFTRDDGQKITMIIFLCKPYEGNVELSKKHETFLWMNLDEAKSKIHKAFHKSIDTFNKYFSKN